MAVDRSFLPLTKSAAALLVGISVLAAVVFTADSQAEPADDLVKVTFQLHAPDLPSDSTVHLTGSVPELGDWDPEQVEMSARGDHRWSFCLECPAIRVIEYKYTLGSWEKEGADATGQPLPNFSIRADKNVEVKDQVSFWTQSGRRIIQGQITGTVRYHLQLKAPGMQPHDLIVWLPPIYEQSDVRYPVLYMHDGQNIIDPKTSAFGIDWQIDETCTQLIESDSMPPLIVVGIYNTPDRSKEYLPGAAGVEYMNYVTEVVKPLIDRKYRTLPDRKHTLVGGSSAGGLCAFMMAWEYPAIFSRALCFSPAFQKENSARGVNFDYVQHVKESPRPEFPLRIYIDNGGIGLEQLLQPGIDAMLAALEQKGLRRDRDYYWNLDPGARHSESAWAKRFPDALLKLLSQTTD